MAKKATKNISLPIAEAVTMPVDRSAEERKYKAQDALRTIEQAETYKRDKSLMGDVKKLAKEKMNSLKKIC